MTKQEFIDTFMDGALTLNDHKELAPTLVGMIWELRREVRAKKIQIEEMDDIARDHEISVKCRSCGNHWVPDCELSEITPDGNYCGKDQNCVP